MDKWKAEHHRWRISEAALIGLCFIGGSIGGLAGMYVFHHKTRKPLFYVGIPVILLVQVLALVAILKYHGA